MSKQYDEKDVAVHHEDVESSPSPTRARDYSIDGPEPGVTFKTWIVIFWMAVGFGFSFFAVPLFGAVQTDIAADLGDPLSTYWFIPSWSLAITVAFMLGGANTDLLGRRWFLILGNAFSFIGNLVIGTAQSGGAAIAGFTIVGFGAGFCQMSTWVIPSLDSCRVGTKLSLSNRRMLTRTLASPCQNSSPTGGAMLELRYVVRLTPKYC